MDIGCAKYVYRVFNKCGTSKIAVGVMGDNKRKLKLIILREK